MLCLCYLNLYYLHCLWVESKPDFFFFFFSLTYYLSFYFTLMVYIQYIYSIYDIYIIWCFHPMSIPAHFLLIIIIASPYDHLFYFISFFFFLFFSFSFSFLFYFILSYFIWGKVTFRWGQVLFILFTLFPFYIHSFLHPLVTRSQSGLSNELS